MSVHTVNGQEFQNRQETGHRVSGSDFSESRKMRIDVQAICKLMNDVHHLDPMQCSNEQMTAIKGMLMKTVERQIIVDEYRALVRRYGIHEMKKILKGILQFVGSVQVPQQNLNSNENINNVDQHIPAAPAMNPPVQHEERGPPNSHELIELPDNSDALTMAFSQFVI